MSVFLFTHSNETEPVFQSILEHLLNVNYFSNAEIYLMEWTENNEKKVFMMCRNFC